MDLSDPQAGELCPQRSLTNWRERFDRRRKIAICGKAPDTLPAAPWSDESWQIWILNDMVTRNECKRWDACFEIHDHPFQSLSTHRQWMQQRHGKPIVTNRQRDEVPDCLPVPTEEIVAAVGRYLNNTVSWMLAMAILLKPESIGLWGVNMAQDAEYKEQRPSCEYLIGLAVGRGISVVVPKASDLLKCDCLYGVERNPLADKYDARKRELEQRLTDARARENQTTTERIFLEGMLGELKYQESFRA